MANGIGPQIPPELAAKLGIKVQASNDQVEEEKGEDTSEPERDTIGPAMPPPSVLQKLQTQPATAPKPEGNQTNSDSDSDDDLVGPSIAMAGYSEVQALRQTIDLVEARIHNSEEAKTAGTTDDGKEKREEWMLVPPSAESRGTVRGSKPGSKGSAAAAPLFDKSWTETPAERRARKEKQKEQSSSSRRRRRVDEQPEEETPDMRRRREENEGKAKWIEEYNRVQRPKSLLEMHLESKQRGKGKDREGRRRHGSSKRDDDRHGDSDGGDSDGEWKRQRFDRSRDLSSGKIDARRQRELLNDMGFLSDKYAPSKGGSYM
ncbi:hypothetical protein GQ54DRAFT_287474 [Martensiomyces pterosporus]|nr:hypothetical protein GQ54DRAFT_287474 [Martensiomyces pterosporus]